MRRRIPDRPTFDRSEYNVRTDVDEKQPQLIGGLCLEWNFIEDMLDYTLFEAWEMDWDVAIEVASRINGMEGKFAVIKECVRTVKRHPEPIPSIVDTTINAVAEYKRYRDGVIHARLLDPKSDVATTSVNRGRADEVLVTEDALDGLLTRLQVLSHEMVALANALALTFIDDYHNYAPKSGEPLELFQAHIAKIQKQQKHRLSLPPLPAFPQAPRADPNSGASE